MPINKDKMKDLATEFGGNQSDTGSAGTQIAVLTERINSITSHLKKNKKDHSGRRGLILLVSKRVCK